MNHALFHNKNNLSENSQFLRYLVRFQGVDSTNQRKINCLPCYKYVVANATLELNTLNVALATTYL